MKIKYNNLFIITPIFFAIALVMSFLDYKDEIKELDWGIKSKAESIAIPSRIFIEHMLKENTLVEVSEELKIKFEKVLKHKQATRMYISKKSRILVDTKQERKSNIVVIRKLKETRITDFFLENNLKLVTIHMPIKAEEKNLVLSIDVDCSSFYDDKETALMEMILTIIFAIIFGIITSVILSRIVIAKIHELNADAKAIASGNYNHNSYIESIREFTDLGDTLNIMKSIMNEIIFKAKNTMLKEEKLQDDNDLADMFYSTSNTNELLSIKDTSLYIISTGRRKPEYFYDSFVYQNQIFAYFGKIEARKSTIATLLNASAIQNYIKSSIESSRFDASKMSDIFQITAFELICLSENNSIKTTKLQESSLEVSEITLQNETVNFRCMEESAVKNKLNLYIDNYQDLQLSLLVNDLPSILENKEFDIFILFQKKSLS